MPNREKENESRTQAPMDRSSTQERRSQPNQGQNRNDNRGGSQKQDNNSSRINEQQRRRGQEDDE